MMFFAATVAIILVGLVLLLLCRKLPLNSLLRGGFMGLIVGFTAGFLTAYLFELSHWLGPVDLSLPSLIIGNRAVGSSVWLPLVASAVGLVVGLMLSVLRRRRGEKAMK